MGVAESRNGKAIAERMDFALGGGSNGDGSDKRVIKAGSLVIVFLSHDDLAHVYVKAGEILNNKWGSFHHDDIIGKTFGCHWESRGQKGWVYALAPTPELWAMALPHRTQIVQPLDAASLPHVYVQL